jgi:hypothetical protein
MGEEMHRSEEEFVYYRCYGCLDPLSSEVELSTHETSCPAMVLVDKYETEIESMREMIHTELHRTFLREQGYEDSLFRLENNMTDLKRTYTRFTSLLTSL